MRPKGIYTRIYFDIHQEIVISRHALLRAAERGIAYPEQIENVIRTGKIVRVGKTLVKFIGRSGITCIGEVSDTHIVIITVERGNEP